MTLHRLWVERSYTCTLLSNILCMRKCLFSVLRLFNALLLCYDVCRWFVVEMISIQKLYYIWEEHWSRSKIMWEKTRALLTTEQSDQTQNQTQKTGPPQDNCKQHVVVDRGDGAKYQRTRVQRWMDWVTDWLTDLRIIRRWFGGVKSTEFSAVRILESFSA